VFDFDVKVMQWDGAAVLNYKKEVRNYNSEQNGKVEKRFLSLLI